MLIKSCCLLMFIFSECLTTQITELAVPGELRLRTSEAQQVLLDCQYELDSDDGLVVAWYFNKVLVYQWIKDREPSAGHLFKDHIDLKYNISNLPNQRYRAVRLLDAGAAFSGDYECKVSTFDSEDIKDKRMQFYDPGEGPTLSYTVTAGNMANDTGVADGSVVIIECEAGLVFPQPEITITVNGQVVNQTQSNWKSEEGLYNSTAEASVPVAELSDGMELRCELTLPYTSYNSSDFIIYSDGEVTSEMSPAAEAARPAAVGAGSRWAAGGVAGVTASWLLLLAVFAASLTNLVLQRTPH